MNLTCMYIFFSQQPAILMRRIFLVWRKACKYLNNTTSKWRISTWIFFWWFLYIYHFISWDTHFYWKSIRSSIYFRNHTLRFDYSSSLHEKIEDEVIPIDYIKPYAKNSVRIIERSIGNNTGQRLHKLKTGI